MLVDTHCHLSSKNFLEDMEEVVMRAREAGVEKIIVPAINVEDAKNIIKITENFNEVYGLAGIYPGEAQKCRDWHVEIEQLHRILDEKKILGIGEIGIDCYWDRRNTDLEAEVFRTQMELAAKKDLPVVIHNRDAEKEIMEVIDDLKTIPRGQFHCWSGSDHFLEYVLQRGYYVSFGGNVTYPSNNKLREQVEIVPLDRLVLETDSPYLSPQGKRGERNEPINVKITAEFLAGVKKVSFNKLIEQTRKNVTALYGI